MFSEIKHQAQDTARRAALGGAGSLLCVVGAGFFTASAYLILAQMFGAVEATALVGAAYVGVGLIVIGASRMRSQPHHTVDHHLAQATEQPPVHEQAGALPPLAAAFAHGMTQGMAARQNRH